jgi:transcription antitermination protein NusB
MGTRRQGRILAFQSLFRYDLSQAALPDLLDFSWSQGGGIEDPAYDEACAFARLLISGTLEHLPEIDRQIKAQLQHWDFDRLARVDCANLRMSVYALLFQKDIPASVTIDEAIDIAKEFGSDDSYKFINGVLDAIAKKPDAPAGA